jgi:predicted dehydrogenase
MTSNSLCKVAFIGAGYMAGEHLKAFKDIPEVEIVGIYSRTKSRAESLYPGGVYDSIEKLYEESRPQLVVICVPELEARKVCIEAFKYQWACLVEKPAGLDVKDAEQILSVAKTLNRNVFVALNRRHYSSTRSVLENITEFPGKRFIHVLDQEDQIGARKAGQPEIVVQNWMYANSIHVLDYFSIFARGNIISIEPIIPWSLNDPWLVITKITYSSGDIGIYEAIWNAPGPWAVAITTEKRRWEMRPLEFSTFQSYGSRNSESFTLNQWDKEFKPGLRLQASEAIKAVKGQPHNLPSLEDAMKSMKLVHSIYGESI